MNEPIDLTKPPVDPNMVAVLEQALREVKAGKAMGVALVMVFGPGKPGVGMAGQGAAEMHVGAAMLQAQLMDIMQPKQSRVLRA